MSMSKSHVKLFILTFILCQFTLSSCGDTKTKRQKLAVIGAGIGGTSFSYFVQDLLGQDDVEIDIFEKNPDVGGRLGVLTVNGNDYETGGSVIHPKNKYAVDLTKKLGLKQKDDKDSEKLTLIRDDEKVFSTSKWSIITIYKFLRRYGFQFNTLQSSVNKFIESFERIYDLQKALKFYESPQDVLTAMDPVLLNLTKSTYQTFLIEHGYANTLVEEIVQAITLVNYGQPTKSVHSFVGSISVAGADSSLWSVQGGNIHLAKALLNHTKTAKFYPNIIVKSIVKESNSGKYQLVTLPEVKPISSYDKIIIAFPMESQGNSITSTQNQMNFINLPSLPMPNSNVKFHRTVATIICGELQEKYAHDGNIIMLNDGHWYTSLSRIYPTKLTKAELLPVYKIFSPLPLTNNQLNQLFRNIQVQKTFDWLAYPEYSSNGIPPTNQQTFTPFGSSEEIYYLNSMEWMASAIEMSLVSAKNTANKIAQNIKPSSASTTKHKESKKEKAEL